MVSLADACSAAREFSGRNRGHSTPLPAVAALRMTREEQLPDSSPVQADTLLRMTCAKPVASHSHATTLASTISQD